MRNISDIEKRLNYRTIDVKDNDKVTVIIITKMEIYNEYDSNGQIE